MSDLSRLVGENIRRYRESYGWKQTELASKIHATQTAVSYYESGSRVMTIETLVCIADAFAVDPGVLLRPFREAS